MAVVDELRQTNASLIDLASRDLTEFFWAYLGADPVELRDALLQFYPEFIAVYGDMGATVAAEYFEELRADAGARGAYRARLAPTIPDEQAERSLRWAVGPAFNDDWDSALSLLLASSERMIRSVGRETMSGNALEDRTATGYKRVTRLGSCTFCQMLADRGGVYTRGTAYFASHDNCKCEVLPTWEKNPRTVGVAQYRASERTADMSPEQLEKHRARVRAYIGEHYGTTS